MYGICCQLVAQKQACSLDADAENGSSWIGWGSSYNSIPPNILDAAEHSNDESIGGDQVVPVGA